MTEEDVLSRARAIAHELAIGGLSIDAPDMLRALCVMIDAGDRDIARLRAEEIDRVDKRARITAEKWNETYAVGQAVRYWPVLPPIAGVPPEITRTRTPAWTLGDGTVVVSIVGWTGGVRLTHVEVYEMTRPGSPGGEVRR